MAGIRRGEVFRLANHDAEIQWLPFARRRDSGGGENKVNSLQPCKSPRISPRTIADGRPWVKYTTPMFR